MKKFGLLIIISLSLFSCKEKKVNSTASLPEFKTTLDSLNYQIETSSKNSEALLKRAKEFRKIGYLDSALMDLNRKMSLLIEEDDYLLKGNIYMEMHEFENANSAFRQCILEDPENAQCYLQLAQIKQLLGYYNTAISLIDSALYIDQTIPEAYFLKGFSFELRKAAGDSINAISSYQTAVELNPDYYDSYMRLGLLHAAKRDTLAITYYQSAIDVHPKRIEAYYNQAIFFQDNNFLDEAMDNYDQILKIDNESYLALYNQGYLLLVYAEQYEEAKLKFNEALSYEPNYVNAYYNRALCSYNLNDFDSARKDCSQALKLDPQFDLAAMLMSKMDKK